MNDEFWVTFDRNKILGYTKRQPSGRKDRMVKVVVHVPDACFREPESPVVTVNVQPSQVVEPTVEVVVQDAPREEENEQ